MIYRSYDKCIGILFTSDLGAIANNVYSTEIGRNLTFH